MCPQALHTQQEVQILDKTSYRPVSTPQCPIHEQNVSHEIKRQKHVTFFGFFSLLLLPVLRSLGDKWLLVETRAGVSQGN
jgi:hypothetical protein